MKRALFLIPGVVLLASCAQTASDGGSARPNLPTGIEVRFPAAPANAYLSLLTEANESVYQVSVPAGSTAVAVDSTKWAAQSANAQAVGVFLPNQAVASVSTLDAKINLLHWVMWQDKNTDGKMEAGEALDLMTHDRVAYASQAVTVEFTMNQIHEVWKLTQGWGRAEHYVYLPLDASTYERRLSSNPLQRYELHVETPLTSQ